MKILIASGIYPPDIGGPAQYARNLFETWKKTGNEVKVAAYRWERAFPPIIRHILYLLKVIRKGWNADLILVLDTWSAAVPTMIACSLMRKEYIIRTGGDFLWESYTERTGNMVLFRNFYSGDWKARMNSLSFKEKLFYRWGGEALRKARAVIFSTPWQKGIFEKAYKLDPNENFIVENYCGSRLEPVGIENRVFVGGTRVLKWKNINMLEKAFKTARVRIKERGFQDIELDTGKAVYSSFVEKIHHAYAVILVSIGDISPNIIFDAIRAGTPFILTRETGIAEKVKNCAIFVDPQNQNDIADKIVWLADPVNWKAQKEKVARFDFVHTWEEIGEEILKIDEKSKNQNGK